MMVTLSSATILVQFLHTHSRYHLFHVLFFCGCYLKCINYAMNLCVGLQIFKKTKRGGGLFKVEMRIDGLETTVILRAAVEGDGLRR